jgi:hypothetical protein
LTSEAHKNFLIALPALDRRVQDSGSLKAKAAGAGDDFFGDGPALRLIAHDSP